MSTDQPDKDGNVTWDIVANGPKPTPQPPSPHPGSDCGCKSCRKQFGWDG
jgi:hypothetical protein